MAFKNFHRKHYEEAKKEYYKNDSPNHPKNVIIGTLVFFAGVFLFALLINSEIDVDSENDLFEGTISRIIDGDTLVIDGERVRLTVVDTPEKGEEGYEGAKLFLETQCKKGTRAIMDIDDNQPMDQYGKHIALVYCGSNTSVNEMLVDQGYGQIIERYQKVSEFSEIFEMNTK